MTNWQDKYKDLEVGQSAWYWHKDNIRKPTWYPVRVTRSDKNCNKDDSAVFTAFSAYQGYLPDFIEISKDFPNGPKCYDISSKIISNNTK
jgi:hypothetical protein